MITVLLVDDQTLLCEILKTWLDVEKDINVLGVAHNGREAIAKVEELQPDIVLMDIDMPQMDGLQATKIISQRFPKVRVIFLSGHDEDVYLGKSLRSGAKGYLLKNTRAEELVKKIRSVYTNVNLLESLQNSDSLIPLQVQVEELIETYRLKLEDLMATQNAHYSSNNLAQIEQKLEQRLDELEDKIDANQGNKFNQLENKNQSSWRSVRQELINVNSQFNQANRSLSSQFSQQIVNLRQDLEGKLIEALDDWSRQRAALQEWAVQRDEMRPDLEDYELKNRQELISVLNPLRASLEETDQNLKATRNWLKACGLLALLALGLSGYLLLQIKSGSLINPAKGTPGSNVESTNTNSPKRI
ncbi:MAG: response regulator transcription factor [Pleurocapsa sp. SU_5_0]|nr:response regulator transcription factor [Pleurocapsa sp. SU_5_0]NJR45049.1 response regulator transcription factor [Hyellaceae cyanobacterium CSU_1_1]